MELVSAGSSPGAVMVSEMSTAHRMTSLESLLKHNEIAILNILNRLKDIEVTVQSVQHGQNGDTSRNVHLVASETEGLARRVDHVDQAWQMKLQEVETQLKNESRHTMLVNEQAVQRAQSDLEMAMQKLVLLSEDMKRVQSELHMDANLTKQLEKDSQWLLKSFREQFAAHKELADQAQRKVEMLTRIISSEQQQRDQTISSLKQLFADAITECRDETAQADHRSQQNISTLSSDVMEALAKLREEAGLGISKVTHNVSQLEGTQSSLETILRAEVRSRMQVTQEQGQRIGRLEGDVKAHIDAMAQQIRLIEERLSGNLDTARHFTKQAFEAEMEPYQRRLRELETGVNTLTTNVNSTLNIHTGDAPVSLAEVNRRLQQLMGTQQESRDLLNDASTNFRRLLDDTRQQLEDKIHSQHSMDQRLLVDTINSQLATDLDRRLAHQQSQFTSELTSALDRHGNVGRDVESRFQQQLQQLQAQLASRQELHTLEERLVLLGQNTAKQSANAMLTQANDAARSAAGEMLRTLEGRVTSVRDELTKQLTVMNDARSLEREQTWKTLQESVKTLTDDLQRLKLEVTPAQEALAVPLNGLHSQLDSMNQRFVAFVDHHNDEVKRLVQQTDAHDEAFRTFTDPVRRESLDSQLDAASTRLQKQIDEESRTREAMHEEILHRLENAVQMTGELNTIVKRHDNTHKRMVDEIEERNRSQHEALRKMLTESRSDGAAPALQTQIAMQLESVQQKLKDVNTWGDSLTDRLSGYDEELRATKNALRDLKNDDLRTRLDTLQKNHERTVIDIREIKGVDIQSQVERLQKAHERVVKDLREESDDRRRQVDEVSRNMNTARAQEPEVAGPSRDQWDAVQGEIQRERKERRDMTDTLQDKLDSVRKDLQRLSGTQERQDDTEHRLENEVQLREGQVRDLKSQVEIALNAGDGLRKELRQVEGALQANLQSQYDAQRSQQEQQTKTMNDIIQRVNETQSSSSHKETSHTTVQTVDPETRNAVAELQAALPDVKRNLDTLRNRFDTMNADASTKADQNTVLSIKQDVSAFGGDLDALRREIQANKTRVDTLSADRSNADTLSSLKQEVSACRNQVEAVQKEMDSNQKRIDAMKADRSTNVDQSTVSGVKQDVESISGNVDALRKMVDANSTRIDTLNADQTSAVKEKALADVKQELAMVTGHVEALRNVVDADTMKRLEELLKGWPELQGTINNLKESHHSVEKTTTVTQKLDQGTLDMVQKIFDSVPQMEADIKNCMDDVEEMKHTDSQRTVEKTTTVTQKLDQGTLDMVQKIFDSVPQMEADIKNCMSDLEALETRWKDVSPADLSAMKAAIEQIRRDLEPLLHHKFEDEELMDLQRDLNELMEWKASSATGQGGDKAPGAAPPGGQTSRASSSRSETSRALKIALDNEIVARQKGDMDNKAFIESIEKYVLDINIPKLRVDLKRHVEEVVEAMQPLEL